MRERNAAVRGWSAVLLVVLVLLPAVMGALDSGYWFRLIELSLVSSILAGSLNLMTGTTGLVLLGHATSMRSVPTRRHSLPPRPMLGCC